MGRPPKAERGRERQHRSKTARFGNFEGRQGTYHCQFRWITPTLGAPEDARAEREIKTEAAEEGIEIEIEIDPGAFDVPEEVSAPPASPPDKAIQAENETLRGDQEALQQDLATLQDEHTSAQEEVSSLRRALKDKKDSIRVLDRKLRRMSEDQSALKSERDDLAGTLQMWEKMVGEMRTAAKQADENHEKLRKRHKKELQDIQSLANEKLFKQIIPAVDNLDLAVKHAEGNNQASVDQVIEGIKMTAKHLFTSFEQAGLDRVPSEPGSLFDPAIHEAVERVEDDTQPAETIAVSLRPGFALKGRLIRPAQVSVYHGGPPARPAKPQAGDDAVAGEK